jgi:hypothetical protein
LWLKYFKLCLDRDLKPDDVVDEDDDVVDSDNLDSSVVLVSPLLLYNFLDFSSLSLRLELLDALDVVDVDGV